MTATRLGKGRLAALAVRAMVPRVDSRWIKDELFDLGAGILVTSIHACRL
jgi:hypothetical protein